MVRHGESEHNREGLVQGQKDSKLTGQGRKQAELLAERLENNEFEAVYSSDLQRARETADILALHHDTEIVETEKLRERNYGDLEGESFEVWRDLDTEDHHDWKTAGGESLREHKERSMEFLNMLMVENMGKALLVAHGGTIAAVLMHILNCSSRQAWRFRIQNCSITRVQHQEDGWRIEVVGDACHLRD